MSQNYQVCIILQKKLGTSHGVIVIERVNDYICYKNLTALVRSILVKFAQKIAMKLAVFYPLFLGKICRKISCEIGQFFCKFAPKNLAQFDFFPQPIRSLDYLWESPCPKQPLL